MKKNFHDCAFNEYLYWLEHHPKIFHKINKLLKSIERDGAMKGEGKPEKLKHEKGQYSRRIDNSNRLVYEVSSDVITIVSCKGHYEE